MENQENKPNEKPKLDAKAILKGLVLHNHLKAAEQSKEKTDENSLTLKDGKGEEREANS